MSGDKPLVSRKFAIIASMVIIAVLILMLYLLATGSRGGAVNIPAKQQTQLQQKEWELSPLIDKYGITSVPVIIINCKYMRVGTDAPTLGVDKEEAEIGGALCAATNSNTFCSRFGRVPVTVLNSPDCKSGNKTIIYAFHSPSCPNSAAQRVVLDSLISEFPDKLDLEYVCTPIVNQDINYSCPQEFLAGRYNY